MEAESYLYTQYQATWWKHIFKLTSLKKYGLAVTKEFYCLRQIEYHLG